MYKLRKVFTIPAFKRLYSSVTGPTCVLEKLDKKSLITVVGEDAPNYLQGLITNDIQHLFNNCSSQYAMFLNSKGRVLYDSIIYRVDPQTYYIECDSSLVHSLEKHLKMYRLRRKIDVFLNDLQIYVLFDKQCYQEVFSNKGSMCDVKQNLDFDISTIKSDSYKIYKDPRVSQLGFRIISQQGSDLQSELSDSFNLNIDNNSNLTYRKYRYSLGIGEGAIDLPSGNCFPLESNCDYLHGVSFHKGCYIGQELTARTYHTGVTRKRLMPLYFNTSLSELPSEELILNDKVKLGKFRAFEDNVGLALLRLELVQPNMSINIAGSEAVVGKPFWWPVEAPKEKIGLKK